MAVAIKFGLIVFVTIWVKKPSFTNASSQCLYCNAEQYFEHFLEEKNLVNDVCLEYLSRKLCQTTTEVAFTNSADISRRCRTKPWASCQMF